MQTIQSSINKQLVCDYFSWRLLKSNISDAKFILKNELSKNSKVKLFILMRHLAQEFEIKFNLKNSNLTQQVHLADENCKDFFLMSMFELFYQDSLEQENKQFDLDLIKNSNRIFKCSWNRIVSMFAIGGFLAVQSYENGKPSLVSKLAKSTEEVLNSCEDMIKWMQSNDNWDGFVAHFDNIGIFSKLDTNDYTISFSEDHLELETNVTFVLKKRFYELSNIFSLTASLLGITVLIGVYCKN